MALLKLAHADFETRLLLGRDDEIERRWRLVTYVLRRFDRLRSSAHGARAQPVDGAIACDRHQPGDRARPGGIEAPRLAPNGHVYVLQHILSLPSVIQDTEADAKKLRRCILVNDP